MYIWKLQPVLTAEMGITTFVKKAKKAKLSSVWIKIAEGTSKNSNITDTMKEEFTQVCQKLKEAEISVLGWHVTFCKKSEDEFNLNDPVFYNFSICPGNQSSIVRAGKLSSFLVSKLS